MRPSNFFYGVFKAEPYGDPALHTPWLCGPTILHVCEVNSAWPPPPVGFHHGKALRDGVGGSCLLPDSHALELGSAESIFVVSGFAPRRASRPLNAARNLQVLHPA